MSILAAIIIIAAVLFATSLKSKGVKLSNDSCLGGVCAGIAKHFGWDVTATRIIWVILSLTIAGPVVAYILLWILLPRE